MEVLVECGDDYCDEWFVYGIDDLEFKIRKKFPFREFKMEIKDPRFNNHYRNLKTR